MNQSMQTWCGAFLLAALLAIPATLAAAERRNDAGDQLPAGDTVEMFAAIKSKAIEVKFIPKDEREARVIIKNNTQKPLNVKLPDAFAGVPVLAQRAGAGGPARGGQAGGQQQNQGMGGGMGGMGGGGMGMGMMNIPAEKVAQFKVDTVCLEHGKKPPRASIPYEIKPIESFNSKPEIKSLLTAFGKRRMNQRATQAAAWHLANAMTWEQLANKRIENIDGSSEAWFSPQEIQSGMQIAQFAVAQAEEDAKASPGESGSLNSSASKTEN